MNLLSPCAAQAALVHQEKINMTTLCPSIFRAYDIRGIVGDTLTEAGVFQIGKAFAAMVLEKGGTQIVMARDGRKSGPLMSKALCEGILSSGCDVLDVGMVPTPVLYYAAHVLKQRAGVMLTGSHNPANYNGLKMVLDGVALTEQEIQALHQRIVDGKLYDGHGARFAQDLSQRYIQHIAQDVRLARPLKVVIDAGSGVTGQIAPALFRELGCNVQELYCEIDGAFPHHHPDPSDEKNLKDLIRVVKEQKADVGLAFDGDGDRLGVVTCDGDVIWPDRLLMFFALNVLADHPGGKIIYDVKCTNQLEHLVRAHGGTPVMWKTGHSLIKAKMAEMDAQLGGEMSGHFFFKDRWYGFDDALYAGARLLEMLAKRKETSAEIFAAIPNSVNTPELKVQVADEHKFALMQKLVDEAKFKDATDVVTIDGLRVNFADGWGLVRPSNTTPYLVLRFEAGNEAVLQNIQRLFREWMLTVNPELELPF
jgi:phosphomannomutase / phosphoglucomutase